jgi:thiamine biosynthesis lipoprotein
MLKKIFYITMLLVLTALAIGYVSKREVLFTGKTMGTTYHIKVIAGWYKSTGMLPEKIEARLNEINQSMSVFRKDSEISRFNNLKAVGEKLPISDDFYRVMVLAATLYEWTDHAWDGTVMPLVNLWGFGNRGTQHTLPDPKALSEARQWVGFNHILVGEDRSLTKNMEKVTLDLGSIAKGFGVDAVAQLIRENGFSNFIVEIGGEVFAAGVRKDGNPWRVGINRPEKDAPPTQVYRSLPLQEQALATSGDYRNFFEIDGLRYSHVMDPATGYPVANGVVSASVLADNCTIADGLATAIMVMGHEKSLELVNRLPGIECFIVVREPDGTFTDYASAGLKPME